MPPPPGTKLTPPGSAPDSTSVGSGEPVLVTVKLNAVPTVADTLAAEVTTGTVVMAKGCGAALPTAPVTVTSAAPEPDGTVTTSWSGLADVTVAGVVYVPNVTTASARPVPVPVPVTVSDWPTAADVVGWPPTVIAVTGGQSHPDPTGVPRPVARS